LLQLNQVTGKPLGALTNGPIINRVAADGVHSSPASPSSERDDGPERVVEFRPLGPVDEVGHLIGIFGVARLTKPETNVFYGSAGQFVVLECFFETLKL